MIKSNKPLRLAGAALFCAMLQIGQDAGAQALRAEFIETSKVTDFGLEFDKFQFSSRITPQGDCVDVINGYVFVTWYRGGMDDRRVMLSRKRIGSGNWRTIEFPHRHVGFRTDPTIGDSHNTIAVSVCPLDNTIHMLYDMHSYDPVQLPDDFFNYSVSVKNAAFVPDDQFTLALFQPKRTYLEPTGNYSDATYPEFNRGEDGSLIATWRIGGSGNGDVFYSRYDGAAWSVPLKFSTGENSNPSNRWSIYGKMKFEGGKLGYGFSIRWGRSRADDIPFNSGFFYAEATPPFGPNDWRDADGNRVTLPITDPNVVKVGEPTELGIGNLITGGADWSRTTNGGIHFMTVVDRQFVHQYRPLGARAFRVDLNAPLSDMYAAGDYVLMADSFRGRPLIRIAREGTSDWQELYRENSGPTMDYYNVALEGDTLVYYSRSPVGSGADRTVAPLHVTAYRLTIPGIVIPSYPSLANAGPVAHWPLNEGSGTVASDASGSGANGNLRNGVRWGSDETRATHAVFDGINDRISTSFNYALSSRDDFTWAWWANKQSPAGQGNSAIMVGNRFGGTGSENFEFIKFMPASASFANTNRIGDIADFDYFDVPTNRWNHYAMVKSGSIFQWYVNGVARGAPQFINYDETNRLPFFIGGDGNNAPNEHFQGAIDDVVLYDRALNALEVQRVSNGIYGNFGQRAEEFVDNRDSRVRFSGNWQTQSNPADYEGSMSFASQARDSVQYTFEGNLVQVGLRTGGSGGICNIFVNDRLVAANVDTYSASQRNQVIVHEEILSQGTHTIRVEATGRKNPRAAQSNVMFDFFYTANIIAERVEDSNSDVTFRGNWGTQSGGGDSGGSMRFSATPGNRVSYTFTGDRVAVGVRTGAFGGLCNVWLDGEVVARRVNTFSNSVVNSVEIFDSGVISYGEHTIEVESRGEGNTMFDYFDIER